jgi:Sec-independent protein translocase protein TatA
MFGLKPIESIILIIVIVLYDAGRTGKIAVELGSGIRDFREGLMGDEDKDKRITG